MNTFRPTEEDLARLIACPKQITARMPSSAHGFKTENKHRHCAMDLTSGEGQFKVFINRHIIYPENFSFGLRYITEDKELGVITLIRYNGTHGEHAATPDEHYTRPHIHRILAADIAAGNTFPQEHGIEITDKYAGYADGAHAFFTDIGAENYMKFLPGAGNLPEPLFPDGY